MNNTQLSAFFCIIVTLLDLEKQSEEKRNLPRKISPRFAGPNSLVLYYDHCLLVPGRETAMGERRNQEHPRGDTMPHEAESDYSEDGVDFRPIRWMLSLTPTERLEVLQSAVRSLARLRDGAIRS